MISKWQLYVLTHPFTGMEEIDENKEKGENWQHTNTKKNYLLSCISFDYEI